MTTNEDPKTQAPDAGAASATDAAFAGTELDRLQQEVREANDRSLRAHAELENSRKRWRRDLEDEKKYAALPLVRDLLNVLDNLERAIDAAEKSESNPHLLDGVRMVAQMMHGTLEQHGCQRIETEGVAFDPNLHQAIAQEPSATVPPGYVTRAVQAGYKLHDRVVRPAQVFVSTGPAS